MRKHRIYTTSFASVYPLYVAKAEKNGRTKKAVDEIIRWLTGYTQSALEAQKKKQTDFETFFAQAPDLNPLRRQIKGLVCGVRVEAINAPLMQEIRYLDKLIDELAKGRPLAKILRQPSQEAQTQTVPKREATAPKATAPQHAFERFWNTCQPSLIADIKAIDALIKNHAPKLSPVTQGTMLAYGAFQYRYDSGREGTSARIAIASRKNGISLHFNCVNDQGYIAEQFAAHFPKAKVGKSCVAFKRLSDIGEKELVALIKLAQISTGAGER